MRAPGGQAGAVDEEASARRPNLRPRAGESCLKSESVVRGRPPLACRRSRRRVSEKRVREIHHGQHL